MMKNAFISLISLFVLSSPLAGQLQINVSNTGFDHIVYGPGEVFPDSATIIFKSSTKLPRYDVALKTKGLSFQNGLSNTITNNILSDKSGGAEALYSSPVISVEGENTVCIINGSLISDNGESFSSINLWNGGRFVLGKDAFVDLINDAYFTRQLWVWSDGSGIFEIEEGFVADRTENGTVPEGLGSLRFNKCNVITHSTEGLPMGYRPNIDTDTADINSHFVFENTDSSVWKIKSNPQEYKGGLWIDASMIVETNQELNISGVKTVTNASEGGSYTNWGGVMIRKGLSMTKRGLERLVLSGDHGYDSGAFHFIEAGMIEYQTDPFTDNSNVGYMITYKGSTITSPNLKIEVAANATAYFNTPLARIDSIAIAASGYLKIGLLDTLQANTSSYNGTLQLVIPGGLSLKAGDAFKILDVTTSNGSFAAIELDDFDGAITWDFSALYTEGVISIASGEVTTEQEQMIQKHMPVNIFPNPTKELLFLENIETKEVQYTILSIQGQTLLSGIIGNNKSNTIDVSSLAPGTYVLKLFNKNDKDLLETRRFVVQ